MSKRICVVGAGKWGQNHVRILDDLGFLGGVVEPNEAVLRKIRQDYPKTATFSKLEGALKADFDGFVVATPAETHFSVASHILKEGFPTLVEKPLATNLREAQALKQLAAQKQTLLMVGHLLLFHPAVLEIKRLIQTGKIGRLQYIYSNRLNLGTVRTNENILWSFAPHDISIFQFLLAVKPIHVLAKGGEFLQPGIHDSTMTMLEYPGNVIAHIFVSWLHPFKEHRIVVIGSKGMLVYEDASAEKELRFYEKGIDWIKGAPVKREGPSQTTSYKGANPLKQELDYFVAHLDEQDIELANADSAVEVLEILEIASNSLSQARSTPAEISSVAPTAQVHPSCYVDENVKVGEDTKIWHFSHIQSNAQIGKQCSIGQNVNVGNNVRIGDHVKIQNNVSVYEGVTLEDYVFCGPSMVFTNVINPRSKYPQRGSQHYASTVVREGASIGANATIVCGHTIGRHSFIGAGAVVTSDVPDHALMLGVPARQKGWVCECGEILKDPADQKTCRRCQRTYRLHEGRLLFLESDTDFPISHDN